MQAHPVKLSVIIPIYNMGKYLAECLHNVQSQTLADLEIIAINDGSTDDSAAILKHYAEQDPRLRIISRENKGVGPSRNEGILAARGEYIAFLDPDDLFPTADTLQLLYTKATQNHASICGGSLAWFSDSPSCLIQDYGRSQQPSVLKTEGFINYSDYQYEYGFYRFIYQREMLQKHGILFPPYPRFQDPPFMVRAMLVAGRFYAIPTITYAYRKEHKQVNWNRSRTDGLLAGIHDAWQLACAHKLPKLKFYLRWHIAEHYPEIAHLLTGPQMALLDDIDEDLRLSNMSIWKKIFSKHKHFADRTIRKFTILGFTYLYRKQK